MNNTCKSCGSDDTEVIQPDDPKTEPAVRTCYECGYDEQLAE